MLQFYTGRTKTAESKKYTSCCSVWFHFPEVLQCMVRPPDISVAPWKPSGSRPLISDVWRQVARSCILVSRFASCSAITKTWRSAAPHYRLHRDHDGVTRRLNSFFGLQPYNTKITQESAQQALDSWFLPIIFEINCMNRRRCSFIEKATGKDCERDAHLAVKKKLLKWL